MESPEGVNPLQALYVADNYIMEKKYKDAFVILLAILMSPNPPSGYTLKRVARLFAEINGAFPMNEPLLLFSCWYLVR